MNTFEIGLDPKVVLSLPNAEFSLFSKNVSQSKVETRAFAQCSLHPDPPSMVLNFPFHNRRAGHWAYKRNSGLGPLDT